MRSELTQAIDNMSDNEAFLLLIFILVLAFVLSLFTRQTKKESEDGNE